MNPAQPLLASGVLIEGRYQILGKLGEGGFGTVYKARQLATGQQVAIKVLRLVERATSPGETRDMEGLPKSPALRLVERATGSAEKRIARFNREMRLCAQLHHPNIVRLIDTGQMDAELVYAIFEFVPGKNLSDVLEEEGALEPSEVRHIMLQVLDALSCAHAQRVVHRDLKPGNIMIVPTGVRRNALVLDFGIGAIADSADDESYQKITATNEGLGSPGYAAPEQLRGREPSPRSDLFSWGLVFLECLTGRRVYTGSSIPDLLFKQMSDEPVPIPAALEAHPLGRILHRVTAKDVRARDITVAELMRELEACDLSTLPREALLLTSSPHVETLADTEARARNLAHKSTLSISSPTAQPADSAPSISMSMSVREAAPASASPAVASTESPSGRLLDAERRQITAVCCNLNANDDGDGATDLEALDDILRAQQDLTVDIARRFHGHVASVLGDQVLLYFGYPLAREDDAQRAARAALAINEGLRQRSVDIGGAREIQIEAGIGIHTGVVLARDAGERGRADAASIAGTTPTVAARLSALAGPGAIAVSGDTHRLLSGRFVFQAEGVHRIDGATRPVETFILKGERRAEDTDTTTLSGQDTPLIGRDEPMNLLLQLWTRARGGAGKSVLITGEPGIGKSRLTRELGRRIRDDAHTSLECRCAPDSENRALHPVIDVLERVLELGRNATADDRMSKLEVLLSRHGFALAEAVPLFTSLLSIPLGKRYRPLDISPQKQKQMTLDAVLSLLFEMAAQRPLLFVVEDLQWADPTTLELLAQLIGDVPSAHVLAIFSARPEFAVTWPTSAVQQMQLGRLERPQIEQMAREVTGSKLLPVEVLEQVVERTDGVPLFVEELLRMLIDSGVLALRGGRYELMRPLSELAIPTTLRDSLMARLDRLGRAKETAQIAAALGREFSFEVLAAVRGTGDAQLKEDLDRLLAAELIYRKRRLKGALYFFKHALIRDTAYESFPKKARREVHAHIAKVLEERFPEIVENRPELLALHHAAADQKREAVSYAQRAAGAALQRSANAEAIHYARQAIGWLDAVGDARERAELELGLNGIITPALMATRGFGAPELESTVSRSQELIDILGDSPHAFPPLWALMTYHMVRNNRETARALTERFLAIAERTLDVGRQVAALAALGASFYNDGKWKEAQAYLKRAIELYDIRAHRDHAFIYGLDSKAYAHASLSTVSWFLGYPDQSQEHAEAALAWARELDHANTLSGILFGLSCVHHYRRNREKVIELTDALRELAKKYDLPLNLAYGDLIRCWADQDVEGGQKIIATLKACGQRSAMSYWASLVAESEAAAGQYDAAAARIDECLRDVEETGANHYAAELHRLKGVYLLSCASGAEDAEACFRRAIAIARDQQARLPELRATVALSALLKDRGAREEARALLSSISGWFTEGFDMPDLVEAKRVLGELSG